MEFKEKQKTLFGRKRQLVNKATPSELKFKEKLELAGVNFIFQKGFIQGKNYCIVDFYLPKPHKICVEIDGGYHNSQAQKEKDRIKDFYLASQRGFKVVRIKNEEVDGYNIADLFR